MLPHGPVRQLQADHCPQEPAWRGIWTDRKGKGWYVDACREHAPKLSCGLSEGSNPLPQDGTMGLVGPTSSRAISGAVPTAIIGRSGGGGTFA